MKKYIMKFIVLTFLGIFFFASCTEKFQEINTDPDRAKDAPATNVMAFTLRYLGSSYFDVWADMNEPSTYAGYLAKIQYIDEARYTYRPGTVENNWYYGYILLNNINEMKKKAVAEKANNLLGASKVLEALVVQMMTDRWRDIPYSDAIKLDNGVLLPKYDKQEDIYPALLTVLEDAANLLASGSNDVLGEGDLLYKGSITKWQKFANSMRLRLAMRISGVSPALAKSVVESILADPTKYPVMTSNSDNAMFVWPGVTPYEEPWYADSKGRDDHAVSDVLVNALKSLSDPRLGVYALPAVSDGEYRGFTIGATAQPALPSVSRIGTKFRKDAKGFSPLLRYAEVMFNIAEASKKGWNTRTTTKAAYEAAVTASMLENSVAQTAITDYLTTGKGKFDDTTDQIFMQEWISLFKQGMEGWSLYRRTGIPKTHYIAPGTTYTGHNSPPFRYPYPQNELTLNGENIKAFAAEVKDDFWGKKMWWDTRTGVQ
jgi:hypothetical protein